MVWKAKQAVGGFKAGDVVPDEQAEVWNKMFAISPVEQIADALQIKPEQPKKIEQPKKEEKSFFKKKR